MPSRRGCWRSEAAGAAAPAQEPQEPPALNSQCTRATAAAVDFAIATSARSPPVKLLHWEAKDVSRLRQGPPTRRHSLPAAHHNNPSAPVGTAPAYVTDWKAAQPCQLGSQPLAAGCTLRWDSGAQHFALPAHCAAVQAPEAQMALAFLLLRSAKQLGTSLTRLDFLSAELQQAVCSPGAAPPGGSVPSGMLKCIALEAAPLQLGHLFASPYAEHVPLSAAADSHGCAAQGGALLVPRLVPGAATRPAGQRAGQPGCHLVSGGLRGIGLAFACWAGMQASCGAVVALGRSGWAEAGSTQLRPLQLAEQSVSLVKADVSSRADLEAARLAAEQVRSRACGVSLPASKT